VAAQSSTAERVAVAVAPDAFYELRTEASPREVAENLAGRDTFCVALDLKRLGMTVAGACGWIQEFQVQYSRCLAANKRNGFAPTVAVFANKLSREDVSQLRQIGAVTFDRSLVSNQDCQSPADLSERLAQHFAHAQEHIGANSDVATSRSYAVTESDLDTINSYPPGVQTSDLAEFIREVQRWFQINAVARITSACWCSLPTPLEWQTTLAALSASYRADN
jgi:hypothetical protein